MRPTRLLENTLRDVRFALRLLVKERGFALTAILTLGLAIGANTAVFSVIDFMLLRPLPYPAAEELVLLQRLDAESGVVNGTSQDGMTWEAIETAEPSFLAAVYSAWSTGVNLVANSSAVFAQEQRVGHGFFDVLGIAPAIGRSFSREEDIADGPRAAILGHELWSTVFNSEPSIVGESIALRGEPYTVVGVMPPGFRTAAPADLWTPLRPNTTGEGAGTNYEIVARVPAGVSAAAVDVELAAVAAAVNERRGDERARIGLALIDLHAGSVAEARRPLQLLWGGVLLVLVIACVNLSGLLLVRGDRRRREIATRMAIGGSQGAVVRQLIIEGLVLAAIGGLVGLGVAAGTLAIMRDVGAQVLDVWRPVQLDARVLAATAALSIGSALVFGLVPALLARRVDLQAALARGGARGGSGAPSRMPRRLLLVGEVALAVVLLASAGLLLRTFAGLHGQDPGFDLENVATFRVSFHDARYDTRDEVNRTLDEGLSRIREISGVEAASASLGLPYERLLNLGFSLPGIEQPDRPITNVSYVAGDFFRTFRMRITEGRALESGDVADASPVIVVNEDFVRAYLGEGSALGRRVGVSGAEREVVGVVASARQRPSWGGPEPLVTQPTVYLPVAQTSDRFLQIVHTWFAPAWIVRLRSDDAALRSEVERTLQGVDPLLPLAGTASMSEVRLQTLARQRLLAMLAGSLAAVALLLAALGIHALVASSVNERARELGIRLALGSTTTAALRAVAIPGIALAAIGAVVGGGLALTATRALRSMLWGVDPADPLTFAAVALLLLGVAAIASVVPALRVLRMDPAASLRSE